VDGITVSLLFDKMAIFIVAHFAFGRAVLFFLLFLVFLAPGGAQEKPGTDIMMSTNRDLMSMRPA
jgi:hypothetical protein